jgi:hypothetical protein
MREVKPYRTVAGARAALDNGGRFYNLLAMADDDRITKAELAKAAGVFRSEQKAFLFLHMGLADLSDGKRSEVLSLLAPALAKRYKSNGPRRLAPSAVWAEAKAGQLIVVEGYPRFHTRKTHRAIVPMMVGKVMVPIPVEMHYDGYQVFASPTAKGTPAWLVVKRPRARLAETFTRFGGAIRRYTFEDSSGKHSDLFLEPLLFTNLNA